MEEEKKLYPNEIHEPHMVRVYDSSKHGTLRRPPKPYSGKAERKRLKRENVKAMRRSGQWEK